MKYAPCPVKDAKYSSGVMFRIVSASCFKSYIIHSFLSLSHSFPKEIGEEMKRRRERKRERERNRQAEKGRRHEENKREEETSRKERERMSGKEKKRENEFERTYNELTAKFLTVKSNSSMKD